MTRKIILPLAALTCVVVVFLIASRGDKRNMPARPAPDSVVLNEPSTRPAASAPMQVIRGGAMPLAGGERPRSRVYDPITGRVKLEIGAESWKPKPGSEQVYQIVKPDIRVYAPNGQISTITADESEMEIAQAGRKDIEPRRGWLRGHVKVVVDRTTRQWREQNPSLAAREQHPERLIHIGLSDEARFDMENSRLTADGTVTVRSVEAELEARPGREALVLTWNQVDNRAEFLRLQYGGRMVARRSGMVDFSMPSLSGERASIDEPRDSAAARRADRTRPPAPPGGDAAFTEGQPSSHPAGEPLTGEQMAARLHKLIAENPQAGVGASPSRSEKRRQRRAADDSASQAVAQTGASASQPDAATRGVGHVDTYAAVFTGRVRVQQTQGTRVTGGLDCDQLELLFDFGREQRNASGESPSGASSSRPGGRAASRPAGEPTELVIEWDGPLDLHSVDVDPAEQTGRRFDAIATGKVVHLRDAQSEERKGEATCARMIFRKEPSAVWLTGSEQSPAKVWSGDRREITATEIMVDRGRGQGRLTGRGVLRDQAVASDGLSSAGMATGGAAADAGGRRTEPLEIRWSRHVDLELGRLQRRATDAQTGAARMKTSDYLRHADFHGDVAMVHGARSLSGDDVAVGFGPPRKPGALADHVTRLDAAGTVQMRDADQHIAARTLHVDMTLTSDGRNVPTQAIADGDVRVAQAGRTFAGEHVTAEFAALTDAGAGDAKPRTRLVMRHAVASRRVAVRDEAQHLEADADQLDARFDAAGRLEKAVLIGPGDAGWAYTNHGDYAVNGHHVTIDLAHQRVASPGQGHAVFVTRSDFDGRPLSAATAVNITYSQGMTLDGTDNVGIFTGEVHTSTETHELTCDRRLVVRFADRHGVGPAKAGEADGAFDLTKRKDASADSSLARLTRWTRERLAGETGAKQPATRRVQKQPISVVAEGNVAALTSEFDAKGLVQSRMRVSGPTMEVDLRREHLLVPGRGTLLIEDYRLASAAGRPARTPQAADGALMFGAGAGGGGGPSATAFVWANAMSFDAAEALVTFDRTVQMNHLSGNRLLLNRTTADALKANVDALRLGDGREATLDCDNLIVQFARGERAGSSAGAANKRSDPRGFDVQWSELRRLVASGRVYLRDNAGSLRTLTGESLRLDWPSNVVTVAGNADQVAEMNDQDEQTQHVRSWRGPLIRWNRTTGDVDAPGTQVTVR